MHILLADDERINQLYLTDFLQRSGHSVEVASTGTEAVIATERTLFDVVLMDIRMPEMDGMEATRRIRAASDGATASDVPIIAMTAHSTEEDRQRFISAGVTMMVAKPVVERELLAVLLTLGERNP